MAALLGEAFCFAHSPTVAAKRAEARRVGGAVHAAPDIPSAKRLRLKNVADVLSQAEELLASTKQLPNSARRTTAVVSVLQLALKAIEAGEWEARLANVERAIGGGHNVKPRTALTLT